MFGNDIERSSWVLSPANSETVIQLTTPKLRPKPQPKPQPLLNLANSETLIQPTTHKLRQKASTEMTQKEASTCSDDVTLGMMM
jgi:hypothetical protein